uniref:Uncharacterized protein n=1 Tax=Anguilla anguilla TaxID=7936 RepID=A0A0E9PXJ3_ANGAN
MQEGSSDQVLGFEAWPGFCEVACPPASAPFSAAVEEHPRSGRDWFSSWASGWSTQSR